MLVYQRVSEFFFRFAQLRSPVSSCWALWVRPSSRHFGPRLKRDGFPFRFGYLNKILGKRCFWRPEKKPVTGDPLPVLNVVVVVGWFEGKKLTSENNGLGLNFGARGRGRWAKLYRTTFPVFLRCQPSRTFRSGENFWGWSWIMEIFGGRGEVEGILFGRMGSLG